MSLWHNPEERGNCMERAGFLALGQVGTERNCPGGISTPFFFSFYFNKHISFLE